MKTFKEITPKEKRDEIVSMYLSGANSYEELGEYYKVEPVRFGHGCAGIGNQKKTYLCIRIPNRLKIWHARRKRRRSPPKFCSWRPASASLSCRTLP